MQVPCIREASKACSVCCVNPFVGHQEESANHPTSISNSTKTTANISTPQQEFIAATVSSILQPNASFTNHESLPPSEDVFSNLQEAYPFYSRTDLADQIRSHEYNHLSGHSNHVYLDYIGHGLFSYSQLQGHYSRAGLIASASSSSSSLPVVPQHLGSPQVPFFDISHKPSTLSSLLRHDGRRSAFESAVKERVMKYMNISAQDYSLVFTANQASSFTLLANSYPFQTNNKLLTVYDYKNEAVESMTESSIRKGATAMAATFSWPSLRVNSKELRKMIMHRGRKSKTQGLFVFPLQSRMSGQRYSYQWMNLAQENGWHVLLDADSLQDKEMETLGLTLFQPDFVVSSFFKVFGENPSGFSCLFVKKSIVSELNKCSRTKSIGIVSLVPTFWTIPETESSKERTLEMLIMKEEGGLSSSSSSDSSSSEEENLELEEVKGGGEMGKQLSFSAFLKKSDTKVDSEQRVKNQASSDRMEFKGLDHADEVGLIMISSRGRYHVNWLVNALLCLRHPHSENGARLVKLYGPNISIHRGPYVAFNVFDWKGEKVDPLMVQKLADRNQISLLCGILEHLWFKDAYGKEEKEKILEREKAEKVKEGYYYGRDKCEKFDYKISVVTVSIGFLNNFEDLYRLWAFVSRFLDADFVEKERWRYTAINQTTVEV